jgi:hypothetical protein
MSNAAEKSTHRSNPIRGDGEELKVINDDSSSIGTVSNNLKSSIMQESARLSEESDSEPVSQGTPLQSVSGAKSSSGFIELLDEVVIADE